jgi:hypothetical protein
MRYGFVKVAGSAQGLEIRGYEYAQEGIQADRK